MTQKLIVLLCLINAAVAPNCFATTVLVLSNGQTVWIAADSLQSGQSPSGLTAKRLGCKLNGQGSFYWADSGDVVIDDETHFSVESLMKKVQDKNKSIDQIANEFITVAKTPVLEEVQHLYRVVPDMFGDIPTVGSFVFFSVIFVKPENGKPEVRFVYVGMLVDHGKFTPKITGPFDLYPMVRNGIGIRDEALHYFDAHQSRIATDPVQLLRDGIALEASDYPGGVGGPTSILELTGKTFRWVDKGACEHSQ
jgi:hypothetical protein